MSERTIADYNLAKPKAKAVAGQNGTGKQTTLLGMKKQPQLQKPDPPHHMDSMVSTDTEIDVDETRMEAPGVFVEETPVDILDETTVSVDIQWSDLGYNTD